MLNENMIELEYWAENWKDAVFHSGMLLEKNGLATKEYAQAMVDTVEQYGGYMIVAPNVAMPHADSEKGAVGNGICVLRLIEPVYFPKKENKPIRVLISVVSASKQEHMEIMGKVAKKILDPANISILVNGSSEEILSAMNG